MTTPHTETDRFAFYMLRVGATLVRKSDNASVYFQPGDDTADAERNAEHCFEHDEMWKGENMKVFNQWAGQYFS